MPALICAVFASSTSKPVTSKPCAREFHGERQADVAEADDADVRLCGT